MASQADVAVEVTEKEESEEKLSIFVRFRNFYMRNFLPNGIVLSIIVGMLLPQPAVFVSQRIPIVKICIIVLFFTIGLRLRFLEAKTAARSYKEIALGLFLIIFVGPVFSTCVLNHVPEFGSYVGNNQNLKNNSNYTSEENALLGPEEFRLALQIYLMSPNTPATSLIMVGKFLNYVCSSA